MSFEQYGQMAVAAAQQFGLDPSIFLSMIDQESGFEPGAQSGAGAQGIAQFTPETARSLGIDPGDPEQALFASAGLLRSYLDSFGSYPLALAAYNAGPGTVQQYGDVPPFPETQQYVASILGDGAMVSPQGSSSGSYFDTPDKPVKPDTYKGIDINSAAQYAVGHGFVGTDSGGTGFATEYTGPDGRKLTLAQIVDQAVSKPSTAASTNPTAPYTYRGTRYVYDPTTQSYQPTAGGAAATGAAPSSIYSNPAYIQAETARIQAETQALGADLALKQQNQRFLEQKALFEETQGMAKDARDTRALLQQQRLQVADLQLRISQQQQQVAQFNSQQQLETQRLNQQAQTERTGELDKLATNIGTLAQDSGDRGKLASYILASSGQGFGAGASGVTGQDFRTNDSLIPLNSLLHTRQDVLNQPANPYTFTPIQPPDTSNILPPLQAGLNLGGQADTSTQPGAAPTPPLSGNPSTDAGIVNRLLGASVPPDQIRDLINAAGSQATMPKAAGGGVEQGAYISGEAGPEINIPTQDGRTVVLNQEQAKHLGLDLSRLVKMADGGIFSAANPGSIFGEEGQNADTGMAKDFLLKAFQRALGGTPWNQQNLPGPVYAASPGTNPLVERLLASLNALGRGVPMDYFQQQAQQLAPAGVSEGAVRRSA